MLSHLVSHYRLNRPLAKVQNHLDRRAALGLASAALAISAVVLAVKLVQAPSISIYIGNQGNSTLVTKIPGLYSSIDAREIFGSALTVGISMTYIHLSRSEPVIQGLGAAALSEQKNEWLEKSKVLKDDEMKVYQTVLDAGGILNQGDLVIQSGLSKTTVSRTLDLLESKGFVEKRRRGMGTSYSSSEIARNSGVGLILCLNLIYSPDTRD